MQQENVPVTKLWKHERKIRHTQFASLGILQPKNITVPFSQIILRGKFNAFGLV